MRDQFVFKPCVVVLSGTPLSGKTHLANILEKMSNLRVIDVDSVRNEIDESRKINLQVRMLPPEQEKEVMVRSYAELCKRAENIAASGAPVLITGTFSRTEFKSELKRIVEDGSVTVRVFLLTVSDEEAGRRIEKRKSEGSLSNIDSLDKYQWAKSMFGKIDFAKVTEIDSSNAGCANSIIETLEGFEMLA